MDEACQSGGSAGLCSLPLIALSMLVLFAGCGGKSESTAGPVPPEAAGKWAQVAVGMESYGVTQRGEVLKDGEVPMVFSGPVKQLDVVIDSMGWDAVCVVLQSGFLECRGDAPFQPDPARRYHQVSLAFFNACALAQGGQIECITPAGAGGTPAPPGTFIQVAAGSYYSCALDEQREVVCFQDGVPLAGPAGQFQQIAASSSANVCALADDGEVVCWQGETPVAENPVGSPEFDDFVRIAVAWSAACGIRESGDVFCWGADGERSAPTGHFVELSAGSTSSTFCAIRQGGDEYDCWAAW